jgi:hypothetical protein
MSVPQGLLRPYTDITIGNRNTDCDYSSAYISLYTNSDLVGHGMTFTIGRGNDIVSHLF